MFERDDGGFSLIDAILCVLGAIAGIVGAIVIIERFIKPWLDELDNFNLDFSDELCDDDDDYDDLYDLDDDFEFILNKPDDPKKPERGYIQIN